MLVHKNQARKHLKCDVPNLVLWEHLILSTAARKRQERRKGGKTEGKKKEILGSQKNKAVKRCSMRFCSRCVKAKSLFGNQNHSNAEPAHPPAKRLHAMDWRPLARTLQDSNHFDTELFKGLNLALCIRSHALVHLPCLWMNDRPCKIWKLMFRITDSGKYFLLQT